MDPSNRLTHHPYQKSTAVSVATNAELTYKYAIFEGQKFSHWEPIGTNKEGTHTIRVQEDQVRAITVTVWMAPPCFSGI